MQAKNDKKSKKYDKRTAVLYINITAISYAGGKAKGCKSKNYYIEND